MNIKTYQSPKLTLAENEVFVFGSNRDGGFHGCGSAGFASFGESGNVWRKHEYDKKPNGWKGKWNVKGTSVGPQVGTEGKSYAIPTVTRAGAKRSISLETIKESIQTFYAFAKSRPHLKFFVAQENKTGLNGYSAEEMASIYSGEIPENVYFDEGFAKLLNIAPIAPESRQGLKVIVAGSRSITDYNLICAAIKESGFKIAEIVSGTAKGVDSLGEQWAKENDIPVKRFPAPWDDIEGKLPHVIGVTRNGKKFWKKAGSFRNQQMADYADALVAITTGSSGTADMINRAKQKGLTVFVKEVK